MEDLEEPIPEKNQTYPSVSWGKPEDEYGLANTLLILIERNPKIFNDLYPQASKNYFQKKEQCRNLAEMLFANFPEINIHLRNSNGLKHYGFSVFTKLRYLEECFIKVLLTMPPISNWPSQDKIKSHCPFFVRLAPLLWRHMKTRRKFTEHNLSIAHARLQFCSTITVYNPQHAAAQIAFQDSVLRQLQDPLRSRHYYLYGKPRRLGKFQLQEIEPLLDEGEPQANLVHQHELKIKELIGRTTELERIIIELVGKKRRRSFSEQNQQDKADNVPLTKRLRFDERFDKPNLQTPEQTRHSTTKHEFRKTFRYLNSDRDDAEDIPITSTDAMLPRKNYISVPSADFRQAENREEFGPWHSPTNLKPLPQAISHVSSSELFGARLREAAFLEKQPSSLAPPASPHQDENEPAKGFPTATKRQVYTKDKALGSTYLPFLPEKDVTDVSSWEKLDKARLRTWKEKEKVKSERKVTIGFIKHEPFEEWGL